MQPCQTIRLQESTDSFIERAFIRILMHCFVMEFLKQLENRAVKEMKFLYRPVFSSFPAASIIKECKSEIV